MRRSRFATFATIGGESICFLRESVVRHFGGEQAKAMQIPTALQSEPTSAHRMSLGLLPIRHLWLFATFGGEQEEMVGYLWFATFGSEHLWWRKEARYLW